MGPKATAICQVLLAHHKRTCGHADFVADDIHADVVYSSCLTYLDVSKLAGGPMPTFMGPFLDEVTLWCQKRGYPSLASLVVNAKSRRPGPGYDQAPNLTLADWPNEVRRCIGFKRYPERAVA
jgi:hypothetical protein